MNKIRNLIKKNPLYFVFLFPSLVDGVLTLVGQGPQYWSEQRVVNEASPAYYFLLASPWVFAIGSIVWFVFWYWIFRRLKEPINLILMFLFLAGHSWGSTSWIWNLMKRNEIYVSGNQISAMIAWFIPLIYFFLIGLSATHCLRVYMDEGKK